ncbi:MAG: hypothetical protein H7837_09285 [Magnetococcus sp. MYC-9]
MKKSLVLGAAALATLLMAAPQNSQAGEVKMGGYYMFRMQDADSTVSKEVGNADTIQGWSQRLQLNMDFIHDKTTHAHLVTRVLDSQVVTGADGSVLNGGGAGVPFASNAAATAGTWNIRKAWLETEAWGVGVKTGVMPASLNDNLLVNNDDTGFGAIKLSKTFGDVTAVLADVKINEGTFGRGSSNTNGVGSGGTGLSVGGWGSNDDDTDLYILALFGKVNNVNYGVTGAYLHADKDSALVNLGVGTPGTTMTDGWLALTLNTMLGGVDVTGTAIWETGMRGTSAAARNVVTSGSTPLSAIANRMDSGGGLGALRLKGDLSGLSKGSTWNAYGLYASENFTAITSRNPNWSKTWDLGGPGAQDLMNTWAYAAGSSPEENMMAIGASVTFVPAPNWTITPMIDFASVVEDQTVGNAVAGAGSASNFRTTSAWGGGVEVATKLNPATTLAVTGVVVDPNNKDNSNEALGGGGHVLGTTSNSGAGTTGSDTMHVIEATVKMTF